MEKEVMDALCMLHDLAKEDTTYTTQDEQFKIVYKHIEKLQNEIKHQRQQRKYWRDNFYNQQKETVELKEEINRLNDENELLKIITRQYNSYCINTDDDEPRIILAHKHYFDSGVFISNFISKDKIRKYLNSLKYWEDNNTSFLESKGEIFLNKAFIINIFEDLLKES